MRHHETSVLLPCLLHVLKEKKLLVPEIIKKTDGDKKQRIYQSFVLAMAEKYPQKGFKVDKSASGLYTELEEKHTHCYYGQVDMVEETFAWLREKLSDC